MKKILVVLLALVMVVSIFTACRDKNTVETEEVEVTGEVVETEVETETPTEVETEEVTEAVTEEVTEVVTEAEVDG